MEAKKIFGQNFLKNKSILEKMAEVAEVGSADTVLEVGPGLGSLTEVLAARAKKVVAVEKDRDLIPILVEKFQGSKNVKIIQEDILKFENIPGAKIVANIPYYITSHFLKNFLSAKNKPRLLVLMVQYEVAKRISAAPPEMNLLALCTQAYGKVEFIKKISKGNFSPAPKVDSAIIKISNISDNFFRKNKIKEEKFFEILHNAFRQKRKMLRHSLGKKISLPEKYLTRRPEELSLENWKEILR
ncbi:ribosomal RNA small subunit methyltransferase A [Candidatus Giovannonibacteria bacterium RIFCSPLOWO2_01_FULL_46_13]|uniref:Ribosomal RNA small subunit methyltransferase A n=1 Tax=Candidatus Giovannonibacteria bacterium RIFCSPLOWO2_01_FULL_46_13 TaxID=1798352 RepID=A0A1F5X398_9BACT|nr:MAG: ribosomal RNA small subunit methyltransferase A [Candidatus Giovannonibacteria bacterium RIFCSPLOWO2_01_FULL_46_13]